MDFTATSLIIYGDIYVLNIYTFTKLIIMQQLVPRYGVCSTNSNSPKTLWRTTHKLDLPVWLKINYFFALYLLLRIGLLCEFVVLFLVNYDWKHMLTLKYPCTGVAHILLGVLLYTMQPYKMNWMNQVDGMIFTTVGVLWLLLTLNNKGGTILALVFGLIGFTVIVVYHKLYKCMKKCNK